MEHFDKHLVDLHMHSTFSDGRYTPTQLVEEAKEQGIRVIALTDHDSWNGMDEAFAAADKLGAANDGQPVLRVITGVELSTQVELPEGTVPVHVLGYYVDRCCVALKAVMDEKRHGREIRLQKMLDKLKALGYPVEVEAVDAKNRAVGRPHVAKALVAKGYFKSVQEVFDALLHTGGPAYVPQPKLSPMEAVQLIHEAHGIAVMAHPSEAEDEAAKLHIASSDTFVNDVLNSAPFDGLEIYHPSADASAQKKWLDLAKDKHLMVSGGSDFHGIPDRFPPKLGIWPVYDVDVEDLLKWKS